MVFEILLAIWEMTIRKMSWILRPFSCIFEAKEAAILAGLNRAISDCPLFRSIPGNLLVEAAVLDAVSEISEEILYRVSLKGILRWVVLMDLRIFPVNTAMVEKNMLMAFLMPPA